MVEILWHSQMKGRETENTNLNLNRCASSRPYLMGLGLSNESWLPDLSGRFRCACLSASLPELLLDVLSCWRRCPSIPRPPASSNHPLGWNVFRIGLLSFHHLAPLPMLNCAESLAHFVSLIAVLPYSQIVFIAPYTTVKITGATSIFALVQLRFCQENVSSMVRSQGSISQN